MKFSRPAVKHHSHLIKKHFVDYYYPVVWSTKKKKSVYLGKNGKVIRFKDQTKAMDYAIDFITGVHNEPK